jgi:hypothetical protein
MVMVVVLLALLVVLLLFGAGFALHLLWWVALVALALWLIGWMFGAVEGGSRRGWYGR